MILFIFEAGSASLLQQILKNDSVTRKKSRTLSLGSSAVHPTPCEFHL
jgi:hypothetical protein